MATKRARKIPKDKKTVVGSITARIVNQTVIMEDARTGEIVARIPIEIASDVSEAIDLVLMDD
jgi:hypothetical protein